MKAFVALAFAGALGGCAITEDTVSVPYQVSAATPVTGAEFIHVTVTAVDARTTNRGRISTKVNGYGMEMAAIRSKEEVADVVRGALAGEIKARGFQLADGGVRVNAAVDTFFNAFKVGVFAGDAQGQVQLTVSVIDPRGRELYKRQITGQSDKTVELAGGSNAAAALSLALSNALATLFADQGFTHALAGG